MASLILELMKNFPKFLAEYDSDFSALYRNAYMNLFAERFIKVQWYDLALKYLPKLQLLIDSGWFEEIPLFYLVKIIKYLQADNYSVCYAENVTTKNNVSEKKFDLPDPIDRIPWLRDYTPDSNNPNQWLTFVVTPSPRSSSVPAIPIVPQLTPKKLLSNLQITRSNIPSYLSLKLLLQARTGFYVLR